ncbi:MAG: hypothetical protein QM478_11725 [Flavobacteriaceae bacterium]
MSNRYNIAVPGQSYKEKDSGKEKRKWNIVGVAFFNENSSITCKLEQNISISNEFVLFPQK